MDRVVEHAEEEDEVERLELEQPPRLAEVAVYEPVGAPRVSTHFAWRCRSAAKSEKTSSAGESFAIDPARVDAVLRPDFENTQSAKPFDVEHLPRASGSKVRSGSSSVAVVVRSSLTGLGSSTYSVSESSRGTFSGARLVHLQAQPNRRRPGRTARECPQRTRPSVTIWEPYRPARIRLLR